MLLVPSDGVEKRGSDARIIIIIIIRRDFVDWLSPFSLIDVVQELLRATRRDFSLARRRRRRRVTQRSKHGRDDDVLLYKERERRATHIVDATNPIIFFILNKMLVSKIDVYIYIGSLPRLQQNKQTNNREPIFSLHIL